MEYPVLHIFKASLVTELHTDASKDALAGILLQRCDEDGLLHPCYYYSRLTNKAEKNYHSFELESLAVVESIKKFRCYLLGKKFKVVTDCIAFKQSLNKKVPNARVSRWFVTLSEFDFEVEHRSGEKMKHVDALSRANVLKISAGVCEKIIQGQLRDEYLTAIRTALDQGEERNGFCLINGVLYKNENAHNKICVPRAMETGMIREVHERGHFGIKKVKEQLTEDYFIPEVEKKIKYCIDNCVRCIVSDRKRGRAEGELHPIPKGEVPLDTFHVDHIGPMPSTRKCYNYILTVVDAFTKHVWLFATKTTSAEEVIKKLTIISDTFGNPRRIICDRGSAFTSNVQKAINNSWQRSIRMTPFELMIGVKMKEKEDIRINDILQEEIQKMFTDDRNEIRKIACKGIARIQDENRRTYNLQRKSIQKYKIGDIVAIPVTQFGIGRKIKRKFFGPYKIVKTFSNELCEVLKLDEQTEGPMRTTTAFDQIKIWADSGES